MDKELLKIVEETFLIRKIKDVKEISTGNINSTYLVEAEGGIRYILQKINKFVFKKPEQVMQNIRRVSRYIEKKVVYEGGDALREVLHPINTLDGTRFMVDNNEEYWRMYNCIENAKTYDTIDNESIFYEVGNAFGTFQKRLADYPTENLYEAIPDFHNTPKRFEAFKTAVKDDKVGRLKAIEGQKDHPLNKAIKYIFECEEDLKLLDSKKKNGELPIRVTHNDTKVNNVMIDNITGKAICVIDLDTVGPDTALVDFGDAIRSGANPAGEEPKKISDAKLNLKLFESYTKGYLDATLILDEKGNINEDPKKGLTKNEIELLHKSPRILAQELSMRFLGDYINGDEYFKLKEGQPENLNLKRGLVQLYLAEDMKTKEDEMKKIIDDIILSKIKNQVREEILE